MPTKTPIQGIPTVSYYTENGQNYAATPEMIGGNVDTTIDSSRLGSSSLKVAPETTPTGWTGTGQFISTTNANTEANFEKDQEQKFKQQELDVKANKGAIQQTMNAIAGIPERREEIYKEENVDPLRKQVNEYTKQIEGEEHALLRKIEMIEKNSEGKFGGAINDEIQRVTRESVSKQADIAILKSAALREFDTAKAIADRKVEAELEPLKLKLEADKFFYSENKEEFTKSEERLFQQYLTKEQREFDKTTKTAQDLSDIKVDLLTSASEQNAPSSVRAAIQAAQTPEDAINAAGQYAGDILDRQYKQAQTDKLKADIANLPGGANLNLDNVSPEGKALLSSVKNLRFKSNDEANRIIGNITRRVAAGDVTGAVDELKDFGYQKMSPSQQADYDLYATAQSAFESTLNQLNVQNLTAGPYKALAEKAKPYTSIKRDKAYTDLRSVIELGQAQLRKGFYGTAVTGTEAANAQNFLIQDNDTIDVIKWKSDNASKFLSFVNDATIARTVGLDKPNLDDYLTYRVKNKETGQLGSIPRSEYDANSYELINQ